MTAGYLTPDERFAAAIAALGAGPLRTRRFLEGYDPPAAWEACWPPAAIAPIRIGCI